MDTLVLKVVCISKVGAIEACSENVAIAHRPASNDQQGKEGAVGWGEKMGGGKKLTSNREGKMSPETGVDPKFRFY